MKKNLSYPQFEIIESQIFIDPQSWFILDTIANLTLLAKTSKLILNTTIYFQIDLAEVINQLPALQLKRDNLKKLITKLEKDSFLLRKEENIDKKSNKKVWYKLGDPYFTIVGLLPTTLTHSTGKKVLNKQLNIQQTQLNFSPSVDKILAKSRENFSQNTPPSNTIIHNRIPDSDSNELGKKEELPFGQLPIFPSAEEQRLKREATMKYLIEVFKLTQNQVNAIFAHGKDSEIFSFSMHYAQRINDPTIINFTRWIWKCFRKQFSIPKTF
jgi:hypothetical protein